MSRSSEKWCTRFNTCRSWGLPSCATNRGFPSEVSVKFKVPNNFPLDFGMIHKQIHAISCSCMMHRPAMFALAKPDIVHQKPVFCTHRGELCLSIHRNKSTHPVWNPNARALSILTHSTHPDPKAPSVDSYPLSRSSSSSPSYPWPSGAPSPRPPPSPDS